MKFIRQNLALAAGIGLPLLVALLFMVATLIPEWMVAPPRYDAFFTISRYTNDVGSEVRIRVADHRLVAEYKTRSERHIPDIPELYYFDAKTRTTRRIELNIPSETTDQWKEIPVPEAGNSYIEPNNVAPDGYAFINSYNRGGDFWLFPFYNHSNATPAISKDGRVIHILPGERVGWNYNSPAFLGWVIPEKANP